jgi:hypothetical protein
VHSCGYGSLYIIARTGYFAGSDDGSEPAAAIYTLLGTAKLNGLNLEAYLRYVLERLPEHPIKDIDALLPWIVVSQLPAL